MIQILKLTQHSTGGGKGFHYSLPRVVGYYSTMGLAEMARTEHAALPEQKAARVKPSDYTVEVLALITEEQEGM